MEGGGISKPESGNSILLGTGGYPPESGNSILNTACQNVMGKISWRGEGASAVVKMDGAYCNADFDVCGAHRGGGTPSSK